MKIDGFGNQKYDYENKIDGGSKSVNIAALGDIVSFGESTADILGNNAEKSSFLAAGDGSIDSMREQAELLKNNLKAVFNKMDTGSTVEIDGEGIDINDTESDKLVTVVEQIQIKLAMYCDDFQPTVDIDLGDIEKTIGQGTMAYELSEAFSGNGVKPTESNVSDAMDAVEMVSQISEFDDGMKAFILQNNMKPTISNIYIAAHAGYVNRTNVLTDSEWNELKPQIEKIVEQAGLEVDDNILKEARWMLDNEIDITADNLIKSEALNNISEIISGPQLYDRIAAGMTEGYAPKNAVITGESYPWEEAVSAVEVVNAATEGNIMAFAKSEGPHTLDTLADIESKGMEIKVDYQDADYITEYRRLQEIRLMMTISAARTMEKNGISVNTTELSELVEELRKTEENLFAEPDMAGKSVENDRSFDKDYELTLNTLLAVSEIKTAHIAVVGQVTESDETITINAISSYASSVTAKMAAAGEAYEALSTEIRSDLGDTVSKAIKASTADILANLGYDNTEANKRAVRILAYNDMEINTVNIDKVKNIDYCVNELFDNMKPEKVLKMIREGMDPLNTSVEELNDYFLNMETESQLVEKYSEFLYRMEKTNSITSEEREKFIGVYSLVTRFKKDGMKAAGQLANQGLDITMGNLLTAFMTGKDRGINLEVDINTGLGEVKDRVSYYKNLLSGAKNKITPQALSEMGEELYDMTPEEFSEALNKTEKSQADVLYEKYLDTAREATMLSEDVYRMITENEIPDTYNNLFAADRLLKEPKQFFDGLESPENLEKELADALEDKESINNKYEALMEQAKKLVINATATEKTYVDMNSLRMLGNNMNLLTGLAKRNNFYIPYEKEGTAGIINLRIMESGEQEGIFTINMDGITVEGKVGREQINARIMTGENTEVQAEMIEQIEAELKAAGFSEVKLSANTAKDRPHGKSAVKEGVATNRIFKAAKIFVENLAK